VCAREQQYYGLVQQYTPPGLEGLRGIFGAEGGCGSVGVGVCFDGTRGIEGGVPPKASLVQSYWAVGSVDIYL